MSAAVTMPDRAALTARAALASVAVASFLLVLKAYAAWATGSVAMLGSLADTGLDVDRLAGHPVRRPRRRHAGRPRPSLRPRQGGGARGAGPGRDHLVSAIGIGWRAVDRLIDGAQTANAEYGIAVSLVAIAAHARADRLSALGRPPHRLGRDPHRQCPLSERSVPQSVGDRGAGARSICRLQRRRSPVRPRHRLVADLRRLARVEPRASTS